MIIIAPLVSSSVKVNLPPPNRFNNGGYPADHRYSPIDVAIYVASPQSKNYNNLKEFFESKYAINAMSKLQIGILRNDEVLLKSILDWRTEADEQELKLLKKVAPYAFD
jgi:hypothetical protein